MVLKHDVDGPSISSMVQEKMDADHPCDMTFDRSVPLFRPISLEVMRPSEPPSYEEIEVLLDEAALRAEGEVRFIVLVGFKGFLSFD